MGELFVPGLRRGRTILPYQARTGESEALQEKLRGANVLTGAVGPMGQKRLWVNFSTPPEKPPQCFGGEAEACNPGSGGDQVLHRSRVCHGSLWYQGRRVSGEGTSHHEGCTAVGCGWAKENALAEMLGPKFLQVWTPLKGLVR